MLLIHLSRQYLRRICWKCDEEKTNLKFIFLKLNAFFLLVSEINNHDRSLCFSHVNAYEILETVTGNEEIYDIFQFTAKEQPVEDKDRLKATNIHWKQTACQIYRKPAKMLDFQGTESATISQR